MNWEQIEGKWDQVRGEVKTAWGKLTDDDLRQLAGKKDQLVGKIQERYGVLKDEAEKQVDVWLHKLDGAKIEGAKVEGKAKIEAKGPTDKRVS